MLTKFSSISLCCTLTNGNFKHGYLKLFPTIRKLLTVFLILGVETDGGCTCIRKERENTLGKLTGGFCPPGLTILRNILCVKIFGSKCFVHP